VPEATIRRRYRSGLLNFFRLYRALTTTWRVYDNSSDVPRLVASGAASATLVIDDVATWRRIQREAGHES
jgi:predicted ABC-type ATPase